MGIAAALANLCSRVSNEHKQYILNNWAQPNEGIYGFLIRFLESGSPTFEHIALWTILQLLESNNTEINALIIKENETILAGIKNLSASQQQIQQSQIGQTTTQQLLYTNNNTNTNTNTNTTTSTSNEDQFEDPKVELFNLTQQILQILG